MKKWNSYRIVADGHTLTHKINGHKTIQVVDNQENKFSLKGLFALQLHQGPAMKIQFKDMLMLELEDTQEKPKISENIQTLPGFKVTKIHQVNKKEHSSWVAICFDDKGSLYTSNQSGEIYRITLKKGQVQKIE
ncbi:hypothetical protein BSZ32_07755 [Rubritalea profundi]|uniref:3-keto-alpha-glucoside-1,2-lyase/3-keto-2-hydroxy-glucal hydratase domain-containing protein n=1 Tax=Rubritalea profundi TaxID=1658618 RepID=A0A2S7U098_9BACT|nr:hypothetical protein BSZ32_07755 [Rubritalea profundi]